MAQLGMVGLGRMGANMVRRLSVAGHTCVVHDRNVDAMRALAGPGIATAASLAELVAALAPPRALWLMVPAAVVDAVIMDLAPLLAAGDTLVDGGNSYYRDDVRRAGELAKRGVHYLDVGTSGGIAGADRGYCLMVGGDAGSFARLSPIFAALAPGGAAGDSLSGSAAQGFLHCGPPGAGHFVKMVHNGIEYGVMAAYAEGMNILHAANIGAHPRAADAETTPLRDPQFFRYDFDVPQIAELWRHGSVISSWLLDLTARALREDGELAEFTGRVSDSGEGRWTLEAAIEEGVPAPVIASALFARFQSRGNSDFADRLLSAMRKQFGGHAEKKTDHG